MLLLSPPTPAHSNLTALSAGSHPCPLRNIPEITPGQAPEHSSKIPGKGNLGGRRTGKSQPWKVRAMRDEEISPGLCVQLECNFKGGRCR